MKREIRGGILRKVLAIHSSVFSMELVHLDELVDAICDAEESQDEQDTRDAATATPTVTAFVLVTDTMPTNLDVIVYAAERGGHYLLLAGPDAPLAEKWRVAVEQFVANKPDDMIRLLREDLAREEAEANHHDDREICSGPFHARVEATKKTRRIKDLLWCIAEEYGDERVWGDELLNRDLEHQIEKYHLEELHRHQATNPHPAEQHQAAMDAAITPTDTNAPVASAFTIQDILYYTEKRAANAVTEQFGESWRQAATEFVNGQPDYLLRLLHLWLEIQEREASSAPPPHDLRNSNADAVKEARLIVNLLWYIAEEYGGERVWGYQLGRREAERNLNAVVYIRDN